MMIAPVHRHRRRGRDSSLLVNPFYPKDPRASFGKHVLTPTLALTSIIDVTPAVDVSYWDEPAARAAAVRACGSARRRHYRASPSRSAPTSLPPGIAGRGAIVVLGGLHVLSCPDEAAEHADAIAIGDGVSCDREFCTTSRPDVSAPATGGYSRPYSLDPPPRRASCRDRRSSRRRACRDARLHNRCGFCYLSTDGLHMPYRMRGGADRRGDCDGRQPYTVFVDSNLGSRPPTCAHCARRCARSRSSGCRRRRRHRRRDAGAPDGVSELYRRVRRFQVAQRGQSAAARKRTPPPIDYARRVAVLHRYGIQVNGSFVLGFDHDGPDVFERTVSWIEANQLECATFHILTPYPGTPLFRQLEREGRILHRDWNCYDTAHVVFQPKNTTVAELDAGYAWCYDALFSHRSIWRRRPSERARCLPISR
jgi:hypothetical protein